MFESICNILRDLLLTVVKVSSTCTLINIKPKLCIINMINMSHCGKSHWIGLNRLFLQTSSFLENASADFAQNFTNERRNPTNCYYEISFNFYESHRRMQCTCVLFLLNSSFCQPSCYLMYLQST